MSENIFGNGAGSRPVSPSQKGALTPTPKPIQISGREQQRLLCEGSNLTRQAAAGEALVRFVDAVGVCVVAIVKRNLRNRAKRLQLKASK